MESGEAFGICTKRKLSAVSLYSNFSNISLQEDNPIFNRLSNDDNDFNNLNNDVNDGNINYMNNDNRDINRDINFVNNASDIENNLHNSENNFSHNDHGDISYVSTLPQLNLPPVYDEVLMKDRSKSQYSLQKLDIEYLEITADTVYSDHSSRPSLIGDRPLIARDFLFAFAAYICHMFTIGIAVSIGILVIEWLKKFPDSRMTILSVPPLIFGITSAIGLFVGSLINKIGGPGVVIIGGFFQGLMLLISAFANSGYFLFVTVGVSFGIGSSLVYVTIFVVVGIYFGNRATIFISILSTAGPIGGVIFPLFIPYILNIYSWNSCLLILSGFCFNICPLGLFLLFCQNQANKANKRNGILQLPVKLKSSKKLLDFSVFKNIMFSLFLLPLCLSCGNMNLTTSIYASFLDSKGFSLTETTQLLSILCSASIIVRLIVGAILRITGWRFVYLYAIISIGFGISVCISTIFNTYGSLAVCSLFVGLLLGSPCGLYPIVILDFVGSKKYSSAIGITETAIGLVTIIEGFLIGVLTNMTGTYNLAFYIFEGASILFNVLLLIILVFQYLKDKKINFKLFKLIFK